MAEYERYNTRNVAQKEIYDSYMGILRISPNEINETEIDDPTQLLNTLYDEEKKQRTKIILSDSDGNILPITFHPRAFETKTIVRDPKYNTDTEQLTDLLHITTVVNQGDGYVFVAENFTSRGTIILEREEDLDTRHSIMRILSGGEFANSAGVRKGEGWVLYPTESPNDANYFNDKNKHQLFDENDNITPRYKQVENALYTWTAEKHARDIGDAERVIVAGKYVNQSNQYNEEIPVYYTRDYILGHYDGHQIRSGIDNNMQHAWGINGGGNIGFSEYVTKLSWTRFDKLIWESLDEILTGSVRHTRGRYDELGVNESADPGIRDLLGFDGNTYKDYAPILGTEMPRGIIMYHAMPFHRYWYHRTRQALRGFIERKKGQLGENLKNFESSGFDSLDKWINDIDQGGGLSIDDGFEGELKNLIHDEIVKLSDFFKNDLITPCSTGTVGFAHSLAKNFVLCNGRTVNFANFPNLSLTNEVIFDTTLKDEEGNVIDTTIGRMATYDPVTGFRTPNAKDGYGLTALGAVGLSSSGDIGSVKTPNLFALFESTPRFIRGLNWKVTNDSDNVTVFHMVESSIDYAKEFDTSDDTPMEKNPVQMEIVKIKPENASEDSPTFKMLKPFETTDKLNFHTYDHLVEKEIHHHNMFSSINGGESGNSIYDQLHYYHCRNTRGGHCSHVYQWMFTALMNMDRTFSQTDIFASPGSYNFAVSDSNAWRDMNYLNYCFGGIYNGEYYKEFTPIPNLGLIAFNTSIFNNIGAADAGNRGTLKDIEQRIHDYDKSLCYYDGEGNHHALDAAHIASIGETTLILGDEITLTLTDDVTNNSDVIKAHDAEKQRRKFMAIKMNEAEGFIPISVAGKGQGGVILGWSRDERSGSKSASRNTYHDHKYNVASYIMTEYTMPSDTADQHYWRCWSSIAYLNPAKLGVGDVERYIENRMNFNEETDYYDVNSVTQLPQNEKNRSYKYGGVPVTVDESCPSPTRLNLLPLIRI